jgi:low affinity Fe/Cu permease
MNLHETWSKVATKAVVVSGSIWAFLSALLIVLVWLVTGPIFGFSDTWQLVINTGTTIVTFLMVFLIQHGQTRDIRAIHLKLDELVRAVGGASNELIDVEERSDHELRALDEKYRRIAKRENHKGKRKSSG